MSIGLAKPALPEFGFAVYPFYCLHHSLARDLNCDGLACFVESSRSRSLKLANSFCFRLFRFSLLSARFYWDAKAKLNKFKF